MNFTDNINTIYYLLKMYIEYFLLNSRIIKINKV